MHRTFGAVDALSGLSVVAPAGAVTVLVGPNGAGKTTALRVITGALRPDAGTVRTFGLDPEIDGGTVRRRCGVVAARPALYDRLTGLDNLRYAAALYGLGRGAGAAGAIAAAAGRFGIADALGQKVGGYSTGMKTRLALSRAVMHGPDLLLLDEPTSGLDPESSHAVLEMIKAMTADGTSVVMCTHLLLEAEGLADHLVVLEDGAAVVAGAPGELTRAWWGEAAVRIDAEDRPSLDVLAGAEGVIGYERRGAAVVRVDDLGRVPDLVAALVSSGVRVTRVEPHVPSLEDLYFAVRRRASASAPESDRVAG